GEQEALQQAAYRALAHGERFFEHELRYWRRSDGKQRWLMLRAEILPDGHGYPSDIVGVLLDVTERKTAEERQALLTDELNHRVKNTLAVVQALAAQSFKDQGCEAPLRIFMSRLLALS